jgi:glycosyltransferase involved in cell wall biosynthesis
MSKNISKTIEKYLVEGEKYQNEGDLESAINIYQSAINLNPNAAKAYHALGNVLIRQKNTKDAIEQFKMAIKIQPDLSTSHYRLGELFLQSNDVEQALSYCEKAVLLNPSNWKFQFELAKTYFATEKIEKAIQTYHKVIELNPNCSEAYNQLKLISKQPSITELSSNTIYKLDKKRFNEKLNCQHFSLLFLLPVSGGSGGAHSIVQESLALYRCGFQVKIAVNQCNYNKFLINYSDIPEINQILVGYQTLSELKNIASSFIVVCATVYNSVNILEKIIQNDNSILPAYYIQDYEILFSHKDSPKWLEAWSSYSRIPHAILFAKTHWLCEVISKNHNVIVHKVEPSIDHDVYFPDLNIQNDLIEISAMLRFSTPRRAANRTLSIIHELEIIFKDKISFTLFGSNPSEIETSGFPIPNNVIILNRLTRPEVAQVLRKSDIFLDLSDYQAFGRTGLEAMACACIPVLPKRGGTNEYAISEVNSLIVETTSKEECINKISELIYKDRRKLYEMKINAIVTSSSYTKKKAALSILNLLLTSSYQYYE